VPACDGVQVTAHSNGRLHSGATTCDAISDIPRRHPLVRHGRTCAIADQSRQIAEDRSNDWIAWCREDGSTALMLDRERVNRARLPRPMFLPTIDVGRACRLVIKLIGADHVAVGLDMVAGRSSVPADPSGYPQLIAALKRTTTPENVRKILGENWMRVLGQAKAARSGRPDILCRRHVKSVSWSCHQLVED
jgi:microsomal dipeptidase-like Zn-dependent dipeptidase